MADSLYNIRLLREFSNEYLNRCFYLTLEDMLYAPLVLKVTMAAGLAQCSPVRPAAQPLRPVSLAAERDGLHCRALLVV